MSDFLMGIYLWLKVAHLTFIIAWFAGIMYLPRLFVYHFTADEKMAETFTIMERRLMKGIMTPSMLFVWFFGILLIVANPGLFSTGMWLWVKLVIVMAISAIHFFYAGNMKKFADGERPRTEKFWRMINEAPFILMIIVLIMVLVKPF